MGDRVRANPTGTIRLLLVNVPEWLARDLRVIAVTRADVEVVGELADGLEVLMSTSQIAPDGIVFGLRDARFPGICSHLLGEFPGITLVGVTVGGRQAFVYDTADVIVPIADASARGIVETIRSLAIGC